MTITISDTRNSKKNLTIEELVRGNTYVDTHGNYVMMTDESFVIDIQTGIAFAVTEYGKNDDFTPIKCKLEVYA